MKAIIIGPNGNGEGVYQLITEDGEALCSHFCSHAGYADDDLYRNRPERKEMFDKKGITEFVWIDKSGISEEELVKRNKKWWSENKDKKIEKPEVVIEVSED